MAIEKYEVTLTSGSAGATATATINPIFGKLLKIIVENDATDQPDNDWDLTIYQGTASGPDYDPIFVDAGVSQVKTAAVVYHPVIAASMAVDGSASSLTEVSPVLHNLITITGGNMGNSKIARVKLLVEVT